MLAKGLPGDLGRPASPAWQRGPGVLPESVADLVTALVRVDEALAVSATETICRRPATYPLDEVLVPATKILSAMPEIAGTEAVSFLRAACLRYLDARIALPLAPPADWRRDAKLGCTCRDCGALAAFLANPTEKTWVFAAAEARRRHMEATLGAAGSDVTTATERVGSPHKLVCTKNQASYARRCQQRDQDVTSVGQLRAAG